MASHSRDANIREVEAENKNQVIFSDMLSGRPSWDSAVPKMITTTETTSQGSLSLIIQLHL